MSSDNPGAASTQPGESSSTLGANANTEVKEEELDASISADIASTDHQPDAMNLDGANDMDAQNNNQAPGTAPGQDGLMPGAPPASELRIPTKKDASLREFLSKMDDYAPIPPHPVPQRQQEQEQHDHPSNNNSNVAANDTSSSSVAPQIPDAVTNYYLTLAGLPPPPQTPPHLARLLALATQKFIADIAADAYQYSRIRSSNTTSNNPMGGLGGAAGFGMMGAPGAPGAAGAGAAGAAGGAAGGKDQGKGVNLGVQRPGYGGGGQGGSQGRTVLTMEDLGMAVGEYGVNVKRGEFYR